MLPPGSRVHHAARSQPFCRTDTSFYKENKKPWARTYRSHPPGSAEGRWGIHSITSSALACSVSGTVRPSAFAGAPRSAIHRGEPARRSKQYRDRGSRARVGRRLHATPRRASSRPFSAVLRLITSSYLVVAERPKSPWDKADIAPRHWPRCWSQKRSLANVIQ
jgi:hypothetical protein